MNETTFSVDCTQSFPPTFHRLKFISAQLHHQWIEKLIPLLGDKMQSYRAKDVNILGWPQVRSGFSYAVTEKPE